MQRCHGEPRTLAIAAFNPGCAPLIALYDSRSDRTLSPNNNDKEITELAA